MTSKFPMIAGFRYLVHLLALLSLVLLAGCESKEEKAERYFKSGMEYLEKGDEERALIEFQNVFKYDGFHKEARKTYADVKLRQGKLQEAYSQYLRLIEQYPDTAEVRAILAELAIKGGSWTEAERHGREAVRLAPDDPRSQAIGLALDFRKAVADKDAARQDALAADAETLLAAHPESEITRQIVLNHLVAGPDPLAALPVLDEAIARDPGNIGYQMLKFRLLAQSNDMPATGEHLKQMYGLFPENADVQAALIAWYLAGNDLDGAEAFLRQIAGPPTGATEGHVVLVQFLQRMRGPEAAKAELAALIAANAGSSNADLYGALATSIDFDAGRQAPAIEALQAIVQQAEPSDQTRLLKVMLARMLEATGNSVGAQAAVEEVLAEDATNGEALKLRAAWKIRADRPGEAIVDLRAALDQNPRDVTAMELMAEAHERDGSLDLAGERLAMAVETSGAAAEPSLRYAGFLIRQGRLQPATKVLLDARRVSPGNVAVLGMLGNVYLREQVWADAEEVARTLEQIGSAEAIEAARTIRASALLSQDRVDDGLAFLEEQASLVEGDAAGLALLVEAQIRSGRLDEARQTLEAELAKTPEAPGLRMMLANVIAMQGDPATAETLFRELLAEDPAQDVVVRQLYGLLLSQDRADEARGVLEAGLAARPDSVELLWTQAMERELAGDIPGAIAIYETLYARDSGNIVVANNLASLITSFNDDAASLDRAAAIARRLRDTDVPAFRDTYGWIQYRRGNFEEALTYLALAAAALPQDLLAQIHYGLALAAAGQTEKAVEQLEKALSGAGDSSLPQIAVATGALQTLRSGQPFTPPYVAAAGGTTP